MSQELLNNKELQALIASLGTEDCNDEPLGKFGRMAMKYLHNTNPQRFMILKMTGQMMDIMYNVDIEATRQVENLIQKLLKRNPMPISDDILVKTRHFNTQRAIAEEITILDIVFVAR